MTSLLALSDLCLAAARSDLWVFVCLGVSILFLLIGAGIHSRGQRKRTLVGPIAVAFAPGTPRMGETCQARLSVRPAGPIAVTEIEVRVRARERVSWRETSGGQVRVRSEAALVFDQALPTRRPGTIMPPAQVDEAFEFTIPAEGPPSFRSELNQIEWSLAVTVQVAGLGAFAREYPFQVPPQVLVF